jgi:hypothetical protein
MIDVLLACLILKLNIELILDLNQEMELCHIMDVMQIDHDKLNLNRNKKGNFMAEHLD